MGVSRIKYRMRQGSDMVPEVYVVPISQNYSWHILFLILV